jgi:hypothetical protein
MGKVLVLTGLLVGFFAQAVLSDDVQDRDYLGYAFTLGSSAFFGGAASIEMDAIPSLGPGDKFSAILLVLHTKQLYQPPEVFRTNNIQFGWSRRRFVQELPPAAWPNHPNPGNWVIAEACGGPGCPANRNNYILIRWAWDSTYWPAGSHLFGIKEIMTADRIGMFTGVIMMTIQIMIG